MKESLLKNSVLIAVFFKCFDEEGDENEGVSSKKEADDPDDDEEREVFDGVLNDIDDEDEKLLAGSR